MLFLGILLAGGRGVLGYGGLAPTAPTLAPTCAPGTSSSLCIAGDVVDAAAVNAVFDAWPETIALSSPCRPPGNGSGSVSANPCASPCISCDDDNYVTGLNLTGLGLHGTIPAAVCGLTRLTNLTMDRNHLHGEIPACILCGLPSLEHLDLSDQLQDDALNGSLPGCMGPNLTKLTTLALENNTLTGPVPDGFCSLAKLVSVDMGYNRLTSLPDCLGSLTNLEELRATDNGLTQSFPDSICSLTRLTHLMLNSNALTGPLPLCLGQLVDLKFLLVDSNQLSGELPLGAPGQPGICNMSNLKALQLSDNSGLTPGPVPDCLCNLPLFSIWLSNTARTGEIPTCLGDDAFTTQSTLTNLSLADNPKLTGSIPNTICRLKYLRALFLQNNEGLTGTLPACIGNLNSLIELNLLNVPKLTGSLPAELFALHSLHYLVITGGGGRGREHDTDLPHAPHYVCPADGCPVLWQVNQSSSLSVPTYASAAVALATGTSSPGTLPWLPSVDSLVLVGLGISGTVPEWVMSLSTAIDVVLSGNKLTGTIPSIPPDSPMQVFEAADNKFTGTLDFLRHANAMEELHLADNFISGTLEPWLGLQSLAMTTFSIERNRLSCEVPEVMGEAHEHADGVLNVLSVVAGNVFGCPLPDYVSEVDPGAQVYRCGSNSLWYACKVFAISWCLVMLVGTYIEYHYPPPISSKKKFKPDSQLLRTSVMISTMFVVALVPAFYFAPSVLTCRYGWHITGAYLSPLTSKNHTVWVYVLLGVGGFGGVIAVCKMLLKPTLKYRQRQRALKLELRKRNTQLYLASEKVRGWSVAVFIALLWCSAYTLLNVTLVYIKINSDVFNEDQKQAAVVIFAMIHESMVFFVSPWVMWRFINQIPNGHHMPDNVYVLVITIELITAVVAPLLAFTFASKDCFPFLVQSHVATVKTFIHRVYCMRPNDFGASGCAQTGTVTATVAFIPELEFNGERCISSVITLYTPAYLTVFAIRGLVQGPFWWLLHNRPRWVIPGLRAKGITGHLANKSLGDIVHATNSDPHGKYDAEELMKSSRQIVSEHDVDFSTDASTDDVDPELRAAFEKLVRGSRKRGEEPMYMEVKQALVAAVGADTFETCKGWVQRNMQRMFSREDDDTFRLLQLATIRLRIQNSKLGINSVAIALCAGLVSPVIAVAASLFLISRRRIRRALKHRHRLRSHKSRGRTGRKDVTSIGMNPIFQIPLADHPLNERLLGDDPDASAVAGGNDDGNTDSGSSQPSAVRVRIPTGVMGLDAEEREEDDSDIALQSLIPTRCIAVLLAFHALYLCLFLYSGGLWWGGPLVAVWSAAVFAVLRHEFRPSKFSELDGDPYQATAARSASVTSIEQMESTAEVASANKAHALRFKRGVKASFFSRRTSRRVPPSAAPSKDGYLDVTAHIPAADHVPHPALDGSEPPLAANAENAATAAVVGSSGGPVERTPPSP